MSESYAFHEKFLSDLDFLVIDTQKRSSKVQYIQERVDLSEVYGLYANRKASQQDLKKFAAKHSGRKAFIKRTVRAGIWNKKRSKDLTGFDVMDIKKVAARRI
jgi:hypothetical protein